MSHPESSPRPRDGAGAAAPVPPVAVGEPQPLQVSTARVVLWGIGTWAVALAVTLAVPALHTGSRDWSALTLPAEHSLARALQSSGATPVAHEDGLALSRGDLAEGVLEGVRTVWEAVREDAGEVDGG